MTRSLVGRSLVLTSAAAIAVATLTPDSRNPGPFTPLCVVCGDLGGVDVVLNVLLFLPLGLGLALAGARPLKAIGGMFAASLTIELLQFLVIPGRDPTIVDVIMNSIGGAFGFAIGSRLDSLHRPRPPVGAKLLLAWSGALLALQCVVAYSLVPALTRSSYYGQIDRELGRSVSAFPGEVLEPTVDSVRIPDSELPDDRVRELLLRRQGAVIQATVIPNGCPTETGGIVRIADANAREILVLAQNDADLLFGVRTGAEVLRLRPVRYRLHHVFGPESICALLGDTILLQARYTRTAVLLRAAARGRVDEDTIAPSVSRGWRLFLPVQTYVDSGAKEAALTTIWLFILMFPAGYWAVFATRGVEPENARANATAAVFVLAALTIAFVLVPEVFGLPHACAWEWLVAIGGAGAGAAAACRSVTTNWGRSATRNSGRVNNPN
jgi:VanZ like protein